MRIFTAISVFFKVLFNGKYNKKLSEMDSNIIKLASLEKELESEQARLNLDIQKLKNAPKLEDHGFLDEGACALLSLLQKEARLIDFVQEDLSDVGDSQMGSVSKLIHKDLQKVFSQFVKIEAVADVEEGGTIHLAEGYSNKEFKLTGNVDAKAPFDGTLRHKGWLVSKMNLPKRAKKDQNRVIMAAEVEV
ncbi:MAG: DUF2760 domain-containing protein [Candidatus Cloacimonetes bacterium]|nr:DUF2760 domain-containing protein [Candidatus Cloacimonadota bacterium]